MSTNPSACATTAVQADQSVTEADPTRVEQWLRAGEAVLIDVREPDEHAHERIADARLLPLSRFDPQQAAAFAKPGQRIVMHCRGGRRSSDACRLSAPIAARGFEVVNMTGGIEAWKKAQLPVEVDARVSSISVLRQVQMVVGASVLTGALLAWLVHPAFAVIPAFFGAGLVFAGASGTCGMALVLERMPWNRAVGGAAPRATAASEGAAARE